MLKIASWNVNSVKMRSEHILKWILENNIDILAMQETKTIDEKFPNNIFSNLGYEVLCCGQKMFNGVAIISKHPIHDVVYSLSEADPQKRLLAATIADLRIINLYVPNGGKVNSEKYFYKLDWLEKVNHFIKFQQQNYSKVAVMGDFNIAPTDIDVHNPIMWQDSVMTSSLEREAFFKILDLGLTDSFRYFNPKDPAYTWWDYRAGSYRRNMGLRIDHILLNQNLLNICKETVIDTDPRSWLRPSDHAPIWANLNI